MTDGGRAAALSAALRVIQADGHQPTPALVAVVAARLLRAQGIRDDSGASCDAPASSLRQSSPASSSSTGCGSTAAAGHHHHNPRPMVFRANNQRHSAESRPGRSQSPASGSSSGSKGGKGRVSCQVAGCPQDLAAGRETYTGRYRVCARHIVEPAVVLYADQPRELYRFCNQCFKFEKLAAFDGAKRGCRASLAKRRERSRNKKMQQAAAAAGLPWQPPPQPQGRRGAGAGRPASPGFTSQAQQDGGGFGTPAAAAFASGLLPELASQQAAPAAKAAVGGLMAELLSALSPDAGNGTPAVSNSNSPACPEQGTPSPQLLLLQQLSNQQLAGLFQGPGGAAAALAGASSALPALQVPAARSPPLGAVLSSRDLPLLLQQEQQQGAGAQCSNAGLGWCMSAPLGLVDPSMQRCTSAPNLAGIAGQAGAQAGSHPGLQQLLASAAFGGGELPGSQLLQLQDIDSPRAGQRTQQHPAAAVAAAVSAAAAGKPPAAHDNSEDSGGCGVDDEDDAAWMDVRELSFTLSERCNLQDQGAQQQPGASSRHGAPPSFAQLQGSAAAAGEGMECVRCNQTPSCSHSSSNPPAAPGVVAPAAAAAARAAAARLAAAQQHSGAGGDLASNPCARSVVYNAMLEELTAWYINPGGADGAPAASAPEAQQQLQDKAAHGLALQAARSGPLLAGAGGVDAAAVAAQQVSQVYDQAASDFVSNMELAAAATQAAAALPSPSGSLGDAPSCQQQQLRASSADMVDSWNAAFAAARQQGTLPVAQHTSLEQQQAGHSLPDEKPGGEALLTFRLERQLSAAQKVMLDMERKLAALKSQQQGKP